MAGRLLLHFFRRRTRVNQIPRHASIHEKNFLPRHALTVERYSQLERMVDVVPNRNVFAEKFRTDPLVEHRALIEDGSPGEIIKKKSDEIEHGCRLENHGVSSGWNLLRRAR